MEHAQPPRRTFLTCGPCKFGPKPFTTTHDAAGDKKMDRHIKTVHSEWLNHDNKEESDG